MDKYNEVKFTTGINVQRDKITADNFYYYIDSSGNLKQKDDSNIAMNSSGEITLNQDLVWDTRINRPVERMQQVVISMISNGIEISKRLWIRFHFGVYTSKKG